MREHDIAQMRAGKIVEMNGRWYTVCQRCKKVVRVDKPLLGSLHFCSYDP